MVNNVIVMGRLTRDPELRRTSDGTAVTSFTLAVDRDYTKETTQNVDFLDCVAWRKNAEFVDRNFEKGRKIMVKGRLQSRNWTDKDGNNRKSMEILAEHIYFADSKRA